MTQGFDVRASARYVPISPQKARLVLDLVRGNDVVEAMVAAATAQTVDRQVINIGSGIETSMNGIAQRVIETTGKQVEWMYKEDQNPGPSRMCADIRLAREKLGYKPRVTLEEGLKRMVELDPRFQSTE